MSSYPLATIFHGDVTLERGSDIAEFGWGDLHVNRHVYIYGTANSSSYTSGSLIVTGGVGIGKTVYINENLNVLNGATNLTETHIDTNSATMTITGGNGILTSVGGLIELVSTGGNVLVDSTSKQLQLQGGENIPDAVSIRSTHINGGIQMESGTGNGNINMYAAGGGLLAATSTGNLNMIANNASLNVKVNNQKTGDNLTLSVLGGNDSGILIESYGTNVTHDSIRLVTKNANGKINIYNAFDGSESSIGQGSGSINFLAGSGGFTSTTNTGGSVQLLSQAGSDNYLKVNTNGAGQNLTLGVYNKFNSTLVLESEGTGDAIQINTLGTTGNIRMSQTTGSTGMIDILSGIGGLFLTTQTGGQLAITTHGAQSLYTNTTTTDGQHLRINVTGGTNSYVIIESDASSNTAVQLNAPNGGVNVSGDTGVNISSNGQIEIGTDTNIPVNIGQLGSTTTVNGNLVVNGTTTTVESETLTIRDNIIIVNNGPSVTADAGLGIHRYQYANNVSEGDVVADSPEEQNINVGLTGNTPTTINLSTVSNTTNDYYKDWWLKITTGTGASQVRKIKSYNGSTKIASIYTTSDQSANNYVPVEGMDFITIPDNTSMVNLYPCQYVFNIWDESENQFAYVCSSTSSTGENTIVHYADLRVNDLTANAINVTEINGTTPDSSTYVTLGANTTPVTISGFTQDAGVYTVMIAPAESEMLKTKAYAIFMIGRLPSEGGISLPGTVVRTISVKGAQGEQIDMQWPADGKPQLYFRPAPTYSTTFKIKIISV